MPVQIHGKTYITVAERLTEARKDIKSINTEIIPNDGAVIIKATVITDKGTFTGISSANPAKLIEKSNPYEVAETSAVGRALGFAGYGAIESIASADEMIKAGVNETKEEKKPMTVEEYENKNKCDKCGSAMGISQKGNKYCLKKCWLKPATQPEEEYSQEE